MRRHVVVKGLQRAELARRTGCNLETVRYYEKVGLLPEPPRNA
ncbi:MAG: MerR family DNA-binding transcriptional regulator, partial [Bradyrhizobium sp.]